MLTFKIKDRYNINMCRQLKRLKNIIINDLRKSNNMSAPGKACNFLSVEVRYWQSIANSSTPKLH